MRTSNPNEVPRLLFEKGSSAASGISANTTSADSGNLSAIMPTCALVIQPEDVTGLELVDVGAFSPNWGIDFAMVHNSGYWGYPYLPLESGLLGANSNSDSLPRELDRERVIEAHYVRTSQIFLRFADGFEGTWSFSQLGLDMSEMKLTSIKASASGQSIVAKSKWGDDVELEASSLRALIDPEFAACLEREIASLSIPSERLERIAAKHQPPQEWYDSTETRE